MNSKTNLLKEDLILTAIAKLANNHAKLLDFIFTINPVRLRLPSNELKQRSRALPSNEQAIVNIAVALWVDDLTEEICNLDDKGFSDFIEALEYLKQSS